ncbi:MAG: hypothetical protein JSV00_02000 [bacterium]|nr:MAG: hypothetical protein JSV00_02000 [bacterium]
MKRVLLAALATAVLASVAIAADVSPLRSGRVLAVEKAQAYMYIQARDAEGREFWVATTTCFVTEDSVLEVLVAEHFDRVRSDLLGRDLSDFYSARLIRINGTEVKGFDAHGLPPGCLDLR